MREFLGALTQLGLIKAAMEASSRSSPSKLKIAEIIETPSQKIELEISSLHRPCSLYLYMNLPASYWRN
jgi:hypothetical protein